MAGRDDGARHMARNIRKQVKALMHELDGAVAHCKMIRGMARNPALHTGGANRIGLGALKTAHTAADRHDRLWTAIRSTTQKLPGPERKALRKEVERDLKSVETRIAALDKAARDLIKEIEKVNKEKPPAGVGDDPFVVTIQFLRALVTMWKGWKTMQRKNAP
ncbi:MAG: hypothetical protein H5U19_04595 [Rhodobacteraceae bacterium]|nr:hypothetical protein [Paracoccaceae bacterium]